MRTCVACGNPLVSGHPIEHDGPPRTTTYEFECGCCGHWWLEHEPIPEDWRPTPPIRRRAGGSEASTEGRGKC